MAFFLFTIDIEKLPAISESASRTLIFNECVITSEYPLMYVLQSELTPKSLHQAMALRTISTRDRDDVAFGQGSSLYLKTLTEEIAEYVHLLQTVHRIVNVFFRGKNALPSRD